MFLTRKIWPIGFSLPSNTCSSWWGSGRQRYAGGPLLNARRRWPLWCRPAAAAPGPAAANRIVYGQRATPHQVLTDFAQDMAGQLDVDVALDRMASVLAAATGAVRVEVRSGSGPGAPTGRLGRTDPPRPRPLPLAQRGRAPVPSTRRTRAVAVPHGDQLLGAITVQKPRNEPVSAAEHNPPEHLASQAGLVLRNVRLTAELQARIDDLRASRRRLVQPRTPSGSGSSGTCTTAPSSSSSR